MKDQSPPIRNGLDAAGLSATIRDHGVDVSDPPFMPPAVRCQAWCIPQAGTISRVQCSRDAQVLRGKLRLCGQHASVADKNGFLLSEAGIWWIEHPEPVRAPSADSQPEEK